MLWDECASWLISWLEIIFKEYFAIFSSQRLRKWLKKFQIKHSVSSKSFKLNTNKIFCLRCFVLNFENRERTQSPFSQVDWPKSRFSALDIYYNTFLFLFGRFQLNLTLSRDGLNLSQQKFSRFTLSFCEFQQCEIQRKSSRKKLTSQAIFDAIRI